MRDWRSCDKSVVMFHNWIYKNFELESFLNIFFVKVTSSIDMNNDSWRQKFLVNHVFKNTSKNTCLKMCKIIMFTKMFFAVWHIYCTLLLLSSQARASNLTPPMSTRVFWLLLHCECCISWNLCRSHLYF